MVWRGGMRSGGSVGVRSSQHEKSGSSAPAPPVRHTRFIRYTRYIRYTGGQAPLARQTRCATRADALETACASPRAANSLLQHAARHTGTHSFHSTRACGNDNRKLTIIAYLLCCGPGAPCVCCGSRLYQFMYAIWYMYALFESATAREDIVVCKACSACAACV